MTRNAQSVRSVVVVAEDGAQVRRVRELLDTPEAAASGVSAIDVQHCETVDAASDHLRPSGVVLLWKDHRRGIERLVPHAPVILITDTPDAQLASTAVARGAQDQLVDDPLDPRTLARSIRFAHQRWGRERRYRRRVTECDLVGRRTADAVRDEASLLIGRARQLADQVDHRGQARVGEIVRAGGRLLQLSKVIGEDSHRPSTADEPEPLRIDLGAVVEAEVARARSRYMGATVEVEGELPAVTIAADDCLGLLVETLLANSVVHADPDAPSITVSLSLEDDRAILRVSDDGPPESARLVFDEGLPESDVGRPPGGIDSYLVGQAVRRYGGDAWIENGESDRSVVAVAFPTADPRSGAGD